MEASVHRGWLLRLGLLGVAITACAGDSAPDPGPETPDPCAANDAVFGQAGQICKPAMAEPPSSTMDPPQPTAGATAPPVTTPMPDPPDAGTDDGPDDAGAEPVDCLTDGTGGAGQDLMEQAFTDDEGRASQYHLYAAHVPTAGPVGLLVYFHGDGAYEFENPRWTVADLREQAELHQLLVLVLRSPDTSEGTTWWRAGADNALWARALLEQKVFPEYNIDRARVLVVGYSGGAEFTTQSFLPQHADLLCGGGAVIFGGGGRPWGRRAPAFSPTFIDAFKMHWYTGQDDTGCSDCSCDGFDALAASSGGAQYYEALGFDVSAEQPPGVDHCDLPFAEVVAEQLEAGLLPEP